MPIFFEKSFLPIKKITGIVRMLKKEETTRLTIVKLIEGNIAILMIL